MAPADRRRRLARRSSPRWKNSRYWFTSSGVSGTVIIAGSLAREYARASWDTYSPSGVEWTILLASAAWFAFWFLLFIRHLPALPLAEVKESIHHAARDSSPLPQEVKT